MWLKTIKNGQIIATQIITEVNPSPDKIFSIWGKTWFTFSMENALKGPLQD